jgi:hypothetical protein
MYSLIRKNEGEEGGEVDFRLRLELRVTGMIGISLGERENSVSTLPSW